MAEWLGTALQKLLLRFESARDLRPTAPNSGAVGISGLANRASRKTLLFRAQLTLPHTDRARTALSPLLLTKNMRWTLLSFFLSISMITPTANAQEQSPIGAWRDHFPYRSLIAVEEGGGHVYAASNTGMFRYETATGEVLHLNKTNALNDVGMLGMAWNEALGALLVHYDNGNLDLITGNTSTNIGDIKRSSVIGNKAVYGVHMEGTTAYLACGFGIVVLDLANKEVRETWFIGPSGSKVQVNAITMTGDSIYAATASGLFVANRFAANLASFTNWNKRTDMGIALANGPFDAVERFGDRVLLSANRPGTDGDSLLILEQDGSWTRFAPLFNQEIRDLNVTRNGQYAVVSSNIDIRVFDLALTEVILIYSIEGSSTRPEQAVRSQDGYIWIADRERGLIRAQGNENGTSIIPNGPRTTSAWRMDSSGGALYVATGRVTGTWNSTYLKDGIHIYNDGRWKTLVREDHPLLNGENVFGGAVNDIITVVVDPDDPKHAYVGSWEEGIVELYDELPVQIYNQDNSALGLDINGIEGRLYVSGLDYDRFGDLWITNAWSLNPIVMRSKNGTWHNFTPGNLLNGNLLLGDVTAARNGYKWFVRPRGNGILVYNSGNSPTEAGDDQYKLLDNQTGTGGLPAPDVYAIAEDLEGQIWVGTSRGVAVFYSPEAIFNSDDYDAQQILIEQDGNVQILLETEAVNTIAVDGADRKWIGTQNSGVYLISSDGRQQIHHFTAENSPLPSNTIGNITIDGTTGEVYMATERGIMSYRSDATIGEDDNTCANVFPNPVLPSYTGPIAVTGLVRNSEVKITDVSGNLVYRTTSEGGQAIWNGNDMSGNRASTGVYLVLVSDQSGSFKCNTKVLLAR